MRWFKIHGSATLIILAGWCMHDATLRDENGCVLVMALIVMLSVHNLRRAICDS